ncbi:carboxypeptidase M32 [Geomicrobium sp. JCM 19055]|uniref:carboxypeptidase M32 n=1 Tax=Geomicrobium sp. JCM 19055 TaxID=1460649 RepID=UPI00045ECE41|nr:carboxypeptidase M32 [Geomicrobium sp. JCM 19055]GAJ98404.1 thermostable carboxypeptidase 1 [Geomicrobium sp. JCM 19055]
MSVEQQFLDYVKSINHYIQTLQLLYWDARTKLPRKGQEERSNVIGTVSQQIHHLTTSDELKHLLEGVQKDETVSDVTKRSAILVQKKYDEFTKIPAEEYKEYIMLSSRSELAWEQAKESNDFESFKPYLEKIVAYKKKTIEYLGYEGHPYNCLLDDFEPGMTVEKLDVIFEQLKEVLIPLIQDVVQADRQPDANVLFHHFPKAEQEKLSHAFLETIGYDFEAGRLDETVHPFATGINRNDVRVTTKYNETDFRVALLGTIHEGGHALYEQNIGEHLIGTPASAASSFGIHESQSLFMEKFVGQNEGFWKTNYPVLKKYAGGSFDDVSFDDFYFALNEAKPSFIRIEADELTYCLHVILRYELEKALFSNEIQVEELPTKWNEKMEEYFGIVPDTDSEGVLQDVHWPSGMFGYFPSYALGYIYAAQLKQALVKDIPDFEERIQNGDIKAITAWMTKNVHEHGAMKEPREIIYDATGEDVNAEPLLSYLKDKYTKLYHL